MSADCLWVTTQEGGELRVGCVRTKCANLGEEIREGALFDGGSGYTRLEVARDAYVVSKRERQCLQRWDLRNCGKRRGFDSLWVLQARSGKGEAMLCAPG